MKCRALACFLFISSLVQESSLYAAACCTSATAFGIGRLLLHESFALGLNTSLKQELGSFKENYLFRLHPKEFTHFELRSHLWGIVPFSRDFSFFAQIPFVFPYHKTSAELFARPGLGDLQLGARYQAIGIGQYQHVPGIALSTLVELPTAVTPNSIPPSLYARRVFALALGIVLEQTWLPWFFQTSLGTNIPFPSHLEGAEADWLGAALEGHCAVGRELGEHIVLTGMIGGKYQTAWIKDKKTVPDTQYYHTHIGLALSWRVQPNWTLQGSFTSSLLVPYLGHNTPANLSASIGLRYGHF